MKDTEYSYLSPAEQAVVAQNALIRQVYGWMAVGLGITAIVSLVTVSSPALLQAVFGNRFVFFGLILAELGLVMALSAAMGRISAGTATAMFAGYSALNGVTLSVVFLAYTAESVTSTFFITAGTFGAMSVFGLTTRRDLTSWGSFLFMGLIGVVLASVVNMFTQSDAASWVISAVGVLVFTGLAAYDTWKLKMMASSGMEPRKMAILGALTLYLDFVNLFLMLLRLLGRRR